MYTPPKCIPFDCTPKLHTLILILLSLLNIQKKNLIPDREATVVTSYKDLDLRILFNLIHDQ